VFAVITYVPVLTLWLSRRDFRAMTLMAKHDGCGFDAG
jgi:hypothetical protein